MLSEYQLKMSDLYNVPIVNFKKLTPRTETKKIHRVLEFNQSQWLKPYIEQQKQKKIMRKIEKHCAN